MLVEYCKSKIAYATVTEAELHYEGSISIDETLMKEVAILPGEKVEVLNINNGNRFNTYVIKCEAGSGTICLNGPAARQGVVGDEIIILSYALLSPEEAQGFQAKVIYLNHDNTIKS